MEAAPNREHIRNTAEARAHVKRDGGCYIRPRMRPFSQPAFVPNSVYCGGARQRPKNAASTGAETGPLAGLDRPANVANYAAHRDGTRMQRGAIVAIFG